MYKMKVEELPFFADGQTDLSVFMSTFYAALVVQSYHANFCIQVSLSHSCVQTTELKDCMQTALSG